MQSSYFVRTCNAQSKRKAMTTFADIAPTAAVITTKPVVLKIYEPLEVVGNGLLRSLNCRCSRINAPSAIAMEEDECEILVVCSEFHRDRQSAAAELERLDQLRFRVIYLGELADWQAAGLPTKALHTVLPRDTSDASLEIALRSAYEYFVASNSIRLLEERMDQFCLELDEILSIGKRLTAERDLHELLRLMLDKSCSITGADAATIFLVENAEDGRQQMRFKITQNCSLDLSYDEFVMPLSKQSMAGYVALTGTLLLIDDVYELSPDLEYGFNPSFDRENGYRSRSMLVVPMVDHQQKIIGVIQLINAKRDVTTVLKTPLDFAREVVPFTQSHADFISSIAGQAAVSIENSRLYESIETLFAGFVEASVTAIESRDPTTSGHSSRVSRLTERLAEVVSDTSEGPYAEVRFSPVQLKEIRYAGLLHDFGKVAVREEVFVKPKKLLAEQLLRIRERFRWLKRDAELRCVTGQLAAFRESGERTLQIVEELEHKLAEEQARLDAWIQLILQANEPTMLAEEAPTQLREIHSTQYRDEQGVEHSLLEEEELRTLAIPRGSLTPEEFAEIQSHVTHSWEFLRRIPWTEELERIPEIAASHHEKLDGTGYPRGLKSEEIPLAGKMMAIADIYDALTASDRPYKKAAPHDVALKILHGDVCRGKLDAELMRLFVDERVFDVLGDENPALTKQG